MTVVDSLFISLGLKTDGLAQGFKQAQQKIDAGAKQLSQSLIAPMKAAFGAIAAGLSLGAVTNQYLSQADAVGKLADSMGADVEELQAWGEAAKRAGGSAEGFRSSLSSLNRMLQFTAQTGKGPAAAAFAAMGISATDATGKAKDSFEVLKELSAKAEGMDRQKFAGLAQKLGLDRGTIMLLQSGRAAVDDLIARQKELGVYTKEDTELAAKANDAIADLQQALKAASALVMRVVTPAITKIAKGLTEVVQFVRQNQPLVTAAIGGVATLLSARLIPVLAKTGLTALKAFAPFAPLAALIGTIAVAVDDLWAYMHGGGSAFEGMWKKFGTGEELLAKFTKAWEALKRVGNNAVTSLSDVLASFFDYLALKDGILEKIFGGVFDAVDGIAKMDFGQVASGLNKAFSGTLELVKSIAKDIFKQFVSIDWKGIGKEISTALTEGVTAFLDWLKGISWSELWEDLKDAASGAWDAVKTFAKGFFDGLPPGMQNAINAIEPYVHHLIKIIEGVAIAWAIGTTVQGLQKVGAAVLGVGKALRSVFAIMAANPLGFLLLALGLAIAYWDDIKEAALKFWNMVKDWDWNTVTTVLKDAFNKAWDAVKTYAGTKIDEIKNWFSSAWEDLKKDFARIFDFIPSFSGIVDALKKAFDEALAWIRNLFSGWLSDLGKSIGELIDKIPGVGTVKKGLSAAGDMIGKGVDSVKGFFSWGDSAASAPTPADSMPAQIVNNDTTNSQTTNNMTLRFEQHVDGSGDPRAVANESVRAVRRESSRMFGYQATTGTIPAGLPAGGGGI